MYALNTHNSYHLINSRIAKFSRDHWCLQACVTIPQRHADDHNAHLSLPYMYIAAAELIVMSCHSGSVCNFDIAHWEFPVCYCNTDLIPIGLRLANCASAYAADTSIDLLIVDSASNICYIGDQFAIIVCHPARDISYQKMCCVGRNLRPPLQPFSQSAVLRQSQSMQKQILGSQDGYTRQDIHHLQHCCAFVQSAQ